VLELGTGSGAVSLAIATEHPPARLVVTDVDPRCLEVARRNAADLGLLERIEFVTSEYYDDLPPGVRFDLIVANPPYVSAVEMRELPPDVLDYEPHLALLGGEDGMDSYRHIVPEAPVWLETGGVLAVEVAEARAAEVAALFRATGRFAPVEVRPDLGGRPRVVFGRERP
jgi:release factor glutamine methyltransferase